MNRSIITVASSDNIKTARYASILLGAQNRRVAVDFIMKNGRTRHMVCVPRNQYNQLNGYTSTPLGRKIVSSKANRGMITVAEVYIPDGAKGAPEAFRPRTINLNTITNIEVL